MRTKLTPAVLSDELRKLVTENDITALENLFAIYRKEVTAMRFITEAFLKEERTPGIIQALSRAAEYTQDLTETLVREIEVYFKDTYFISFNPFQRPRGVILTDANSIVEFILIQIGDLFHHAGGGNLREHLREVLSEKPAQQREEVIIIADAVRVQEGSDTAAFRIHPGDNTALWLVAYLKFCYENTTQLSPTEHHVVDGWKLELYPDGVSVGSKNFILEVDANGTVQLHHPSASDALAFANLLELPVGGALQ